ncbi:MAG: MetQ/NlpA family ABC transporter substrate-binding protein [Bifidobacterium sp.]|nr:MetQ/NlpA family ABC transporter substrate-binding protein [Bifidobacterium sp.]
MVTTKDQRDNPTYAAVVRAYHSKSVADTIVRVYKGACLPAFKVS